MHYERFSFPTSPCQLLPTNQSLLLHFNIFHHPPSLYRLSPPPPKKEIIQDVPSLPIPFTWAFWTPSYPLSFNSTFFTTDCHQHQQCSYTRAFLDTPLPPIYLLSSLLYLHTPISTTHNISLLFPLPLLLSLLLLLLLLLSSLFSSKLPLPSIYLSIYLPFSPSTYPPIYLSLITEYRSFEAAPGRSYVRFVFVIVVCIE